MLSCRKFKLKSCLSAGTAGRVPGVSVDETDEDLSPPGEHTSHMCVLVMSDVSHACTDDVY